MERPIDLLTVAAYRAACAAQRVENALAMQSSADAAIELERARVDSALAQQDLHRVRVLIEEMDAPC